jgi:hypothetical protein
VHDAHPGAVELLEDDVHHPSLPSPADLPRHDRSLHARDPDGIARSVRVSCR